MTPLEKQRITDMRHAKCSYSVISSELNIPLSTVKSFCRRNHLADSDLAEGSACLNCGVPISKGRFRPRKFCSDSCRMLWWNSHTDLINRRAVYSFTCKQCNSDFTAYGNSHRLYCSRACYLKARRLKAVSE